MLDLDLNGFRCPGHKRVVSIDFFPSSDSVILGYTMEEILHQLADGFHYNPIVPVFHSYQELQLLVQDFVHGAGRFSILEEDPL